MTPEQTAELDKWAAQSDTRREIEEFMGTVESQGGLDWSWSMAGGLERALDKFFSIDRPLLESARRALLAENTGWTPPVIEIEP